MTRRNFLHTTMTAAFAGTTGLSSLNAYTTTPATPRMPVLFAGHGSPMNGIENNDITRGWQQMVQGMPQQPAAVVFVSAHWETRGTWVTAMDSPKTIHDFGGFPPELFAVQYPAPGSPQLAEQIAQAVPPPAIGTTQEWGLDHGSWTVARHMYPAATVPMLQLSLDVRKTPEQNYQLAQQLRPLRERGILFIGSGNVVHNLRMLNWQSPGRGFDWAVATDTRMRDLMNAGNHQALVQWQKLGAEAEMAINSAEHYLPLLYILGLMHEHEQPVYYNEVMDMGSISMRSLRAG